MTSHAGRYYDNKARISVRMIRSLLTKRWPELVVTALVLALVLKTTIGALGAADLSFDDETLYLDASRPEAAGRWLPLADSSPLYPLWYRALSAFAPDPVNLDYFNWLTLTAALPILLYALALRSGASLVAAATVSVAWSLSHTVWTWPFVSKFATLILATGALAATFAEDRRIATAIASVVLSAAAYARAELTALALLFSGICFVWGLHDALKRKRPRAALVAAVIPALTSVTLRFKFGDPTAGGRAFFAFAQHYALNVVHSKHLTIDPWTNWDKLARPAFPTAQTIFEAARENPSAFLWHIGRNAIRFPEEVVELLDPLPYLPTVLAWVMSAALYAVIILGVVGLHASRRHPDLRLSRWLPLLVIVAIATAGSVLLIQPREHYILPLCFLALAALAGLGTRAVPASIASKLSSRASRLRLQLSLCAALTLLLLALPTWCPDAAPALLSEKGPRHPDVLEGRATVQAIRALALGGRVVILESDHSRGVYANLDFVRVAQWDKQEPSHFQLFAHDVDTQGEFRFIPVTPTNVVLAVRRTLIRQ